MNTPKSLSGLVSELIRRGLPTDYAHRAASELADHHRDLIEELLETGGSESGAAVEASRRLGDARTLVKKTVREYQRRYWCARWPLVTFLLGPIPLVVVSWIAFCLLAVCVVWPLEKLGLIGPHEPDGIISAGERLANLLVVSVIGFAAPAAAMLTLARLAMRAALDWKWLVVSACLLGLTVGMVRCGFGEARLRPQVTEGNPVLADQPLVTIGAPLFAPSWRAALGWYASHAWAWYTYDLQQILQVLFPTVVFAAVVLRAKQLSLRSARLVVDGC